MQPANGKVTKKTGTDPQVVLAKTATEFFQAGAKAREEEYEKAKADAIARGDSRNCIDLLALTRCEIDRIRAGIEAWVDAWLRASESSGVSLGSWTERILGDTADQLTNACITKFATELTSLFRNRAIPQSGEGFCEQDIRKGAESALQGASSGLRDAGLRIARNQMQELLRGVKVATVREVKPWPGEIAVQHFPSPPPTPRHADKANRNNTAENGQPALKVREGPTSVESVNQRAGSSPRRNPQYEEIDAALHSIAESKPKSHDDVFRALDGRVKTPNAKPFKRTHGWSSGFKMDAKAAQVWLSKRWRVLNLPPFPRGPK